MSELQRIVELGKLATVRPYVAFSPEATGSNDWADKAVIAGIRLTSVDRMTVFWTRDAEYIAAACNSADIVAQKLLDIGNAKTIGEVREILERGEA